MLTSSYFHLFMFMSVSFLFFWPGYYPSSKSDDWKGVGLYCLDLILSFCWLLRPFLPAMFPSGRLTPSALTILPLIVTIWSHLLIYIHLSQTSPINLIYRIWAAMKVLKHLRCFSKKNKMEALIGNFKSHCKGPSGPVSMQYFLLDIFSNKTKILKIQWSWWHISIRVMSSWWYKHGCHSLNVFFCPVYFLSIKKHSD